MGLADDIRFFIVENYLKPAIEKDLKEISLVSGEVHSAMGLRSRMPSVCSALRSGELGRLAPVRLLREVRSPSVKLNSSTNRFDYEILQVGSKSPDRKFVDPRPNDALKDVKEGGERKSRTLVIIPCGRAKIWKKNPEAGPTEARDAYTGSLFKVNREYAERFGDKWMILSAKYGFIEPGFVIPEDYNATFRDPTTNPISLDRLIEQARHIKGYDRMVALGSTAYAEMVKGAFEGTDAEILAPTAGLSVIKAVGKVKNAARRERPFGRLMPNEYCERDLLGLEGKLGVRFRDPALLVAAVTRRAYVKELRDRNPETQREDNERLEFLGDGVLELAVRQILYERYRGQEGCLSDMADKIVEKCNLLRLAKNLVLVKYLFLGKSEEKDDEGKPKILADALEAILGALYLDQGYKKTKDVVEKEIIDK